MNAVLDALARANREIETFLKSGEAGNGASRRTSPEVLSSLLGHLEYVSHLLREGQMASGVDSGLKTELALYKRNLETLQQELVSLQSETLARRSQLQSEQMHLTSASCWSRSRHGDR